jgi:hypothetical protein
VLQGSVIKYVASNIACCDKVHKERVYVEYIYEDRKNILQL